MGQAWGQNLKLLFHVASVLVYFLFSDIINLIFK